MRQLDTLQPWRKIAQIVWVVEVSDIMVVIGFLSVTTHSQICKDRTFIEPETQRPVVKLAGIRRMETFVAPGNESILIRKYMDVSFLTFQYLKYQRRKDIFKNNK